MSWGRPLLGTAAELQNILEEIGLVYRMDTFNRVFYTFHRQSIDLFTYREFSLQMTPAAVQKFIMSPLLSFS